MKAAHHAERRTRAVALLTAATMLAEVAAGWWFNSMALLADGWHMGTHAVAIGLSALAYGWARRCFNDPTFAFGAWKIEVLAAFASALALLAAALAIAWASLQRLWLPQPIEYAEAIGVTILGLLVNLLCAWLLEVPHGEQHRQPHPGHPDHLAHHPHPGHAAHGAADLNLRSAYLHVLADAATSALALLALAGGLWLGWAWLDPVVGLVGAAMVARWGVLLVRDTSRVLLDREMDHPLVAEVRRALDERAPWGTRTHVLALRACRVGHGDWAFVLHLVTDDPGLTVERVRRFMRHWPHIVNLTVQIEPAQGLGGTGV